jgi:hypothetical protein
VSAPAFGPGHNSRREPASAWRLHCWTEARRALLPTLPIEIVRLRVARARELGLDYRTYASVRAASGHDVVAFLFSSNALRLLRPRTPCPLTAPSGWRRCATVARVVLAQPPLDAGPLSGAIAERGAAARPGRRGAARLRAWPVLRRALREALGPVPGDGVLLVGDTAFEREWAAAGRLAGYLPAERYFPAAP